MPRDVAGFAAILARKGIRDSRLVILVDPGNSLLGKRYSNQRNLHAKLKSFADEEGVVKIPPHFQKTKTKLPTRSETILFDGMVEEMIASGELVFQQEKKNAGTSVLLQLRKKGLVAWVDPPSSPVMRKTYNLEHWGKSYKLKDNIVILEHMASGQLVEKMISVWTQQFGRREVDVLEVFVALIKIPHRDDRPTETLWTVFLRIAGLLFDAANHYGDELMRMSALLRLEELLKTEPDFKLTGKRLVYSMRRGEEI